MGRRHRHRTRARWDDLRHPPLLCQFEVTAFIEDSESSVPDHSGAEGVGVDAQGSVYGAVVRRQMLERHVKK
jgi:hypothetical protein